MSSQIKEQQQKVDSKRDFDADHLLNQHLFKTLAYTGLGFGAGMVSSLFFKHKAGMTLLFAGAGAGYGLSNMYSDLNNLQRFKNYSNQGQPQTLKREDQLSTKDWESFMPKQQNLGSQKQPQYGGSDDDSHDSKESKSTSQSKGSQSKSPEHSQHHTDVKKPSTPSKSSSQHKEHDKSSQHSGEQKSGSSKVPSHGKESEKTSKQPEKQGKQPEKSKESEKSVKQPEKKESTKLESKPEKKGEGQQLQDFSPKETGKPSPGENPYYKGAERPRKSSREEESVSGNSPTRITEQDRWGQFTQSGPKTKMDPIPETTAGSQFRGRSTAGSQVNAVIE